ncbi:MAG: hypothetical protein ACREQJ_00665 [Candidatus Binatia bacterium]
MQARAVLGLVGFLLFAFTPAPRAYFIIDLEGGGELRADFVREESDAVYASRTSGEVQIERSRIRAIREIDPGVKVDTAKAVAEGVPSAPDPATVPVPSSASNEPANRENQVTRKIILGQRDLLFARLRGDAPEDLAKRERELKALKGERAGFVKRTPASSSASR